MHLRVVKQAMPPVYIIKRNIDSVGGPVL